MLLRAGLIYVLSVLTVLLGGLAAWQHLDIALRDENTAALNKRIAVLQSDLDAAARREEAALRRSRVAEDSLSRNASFNSSDAIKLNEAREVLAIAIRDKAAAEVARSRLEADLAGALKDRDEFRAGRDALQRQTEDARIAAARALQEAGAARQELADSKKAAAGVTTGATHSAVPARPESAVQPPAATAAVGELIRPASEAATIESGGNTSSLVPNAVTIETAVPKTELPADAKRTGAQSDQRRPKPKPAAGSGTAKKPKKQAKKDEPFFPF